MDMRAPTVSAQYTFQNFVIGPCNLFAHSAARAVATKPAEVYNPLFIHSGVGLGKTHLLQAIRHYVLSRPGGKTKAVYLSTEQFTNQLISAIQTGSTQEFRRRFREIDFLLVDDIHFIAGKDATQEEFFHTFNALHDRKRQIVISSDREPKQIPTLEERLVSRFEWGLVARIDPPDFETRLAILEKKSKNCTSHIPANVLQLIAEHVDANIRELEGALTRVVAAASLRGEPPTIELAYDVLKGLFTRTVPRDLTIEDIKQVTAKYFEIKLSDLSSGRRGRIFAFPRQAAMYLSRKLTDASLAEIGRAFGRKDHTTVLHACRKIEEKMKTDPSCKRLVEALLKKMQYSD
ncbi:MAG: chromosomal replication initiator protein DnaA [Candidatus Abyssubacteria bacterium]